MKAVNLSDRLLSFAVQTATVLFMSSSVPLCSTQFLIWARDLATHLPDNEEDATNRGGVANLDLSCPGRMMVQAQDVGRGVVVLTSKGCTPEPPLCVVSSMCPY